MTKQEIYQVLEAKKIVLKNLSWNTILRK